MEVLLGITVYTVGGLLIFLLAMIALLYARMPRRSQGLHTDTLPEMGLDCADSKETPRKRRSAMLKEMLRHLFKDALPINNLFNKQKPFWWLSVTLFFGVCLIGVWTLFLIAGALAALAGIDVDAHATLPAVLCYYPAIPAGVGGFTLTTFGLVILILRRLNDSSLRKQLFIQDFFDLFLALSVLGTGLLLWGGDLTFAGARSVMVQVLSLSQDLPLSPLLFIHLVLLNIMIVYIPLSRIISYGNTYFILRKVVPDNEFTDADRRVDV